MGRLQRVSLRQPSASLQPSRLLLALQVRHQPDAGCAWLLAMQAGMTSGNQVAKSAQSDEKVEDEAEGEDEDQNENDNIICL